MVQHMFCNRYFAFTRDENADTTNNYSLTLRVKLHHVLHVLQNDVTFEHTGSPSKEYTQSSIKRRRLNGMEIKSF